MRKFVPYLLFVLAVVPLAGAYLFGHFSLSHTFMPVVEETDQPTWVRFALEHSVDISPGNWLVDWIMVRAPCHSLSSYQYRWPAT